MKKITILLICLSFGYARSQSTCTSDGTNGEVHSQSRAYSCANSSDAYINTIRTQDHWIPQTNDKVKTLRYQIHIMQDASGGGNWANTIDTYDRFDQINDWLNGFYTTVADHSMFIPGVPDIDDTQLRFDLQNIYFYQDDAMHATSSTSTLENYIKTNYPDRDGVGIFHVFITDGTYGGATGYSYFPQLGDITYSGYSIWTSLNEPSADGSGDFFVAQHLAHEFGHSLDLRHIYSHEHCHITDLDFLSDVFIPGFPGTTPSGSCDVAYYPAACDLSDPTAYCSNNLMSGKGLLSYYISPKQIGRIHRTAYLRETREFIWGYSTTPYIVNSDQTWDFSIKMYEDIVVKPGHTLTVNCEIQMLPEASIIIEPGGRLILDGGVITVAKHSTELWQGIQVWGNSSASQHPSNQGYLVIKNGGVIENAHVAVNLSNPDSFVETGGVVRASNSTFKNNRRDVAFMNYKRTTGAGYEIPNLSYFTNVTFTWDDDFMHTTPLNHVTLYKVNGVLFSGCDFLDDRTNPTSEWLSFERVLNCGIYSIDANYTVKGKCTDWVNNCPGNIGDPNLDPSTFTNLDFGIYASNMSSTYGITVDRSIFRNNLYGVQLVKLQTPTIGRSEFEFDLLENNFTGETLRGIHIVNSQGLRIEENKFENDNYTSETRGIECADLGPTEERIYNNEFKNLSKAQYARGTNRDTDGSTGLQFLCAKNESNEYDHYVSGNQLGNGFPPSDQYGVRTINGSIASPSGTVFTQDGDLYEDYYNYSTHFIAYYYYNGNSDEEPIEVSPDGDYSMVFTSGQPNENTCASTFPTYPVELEFSPATYAGLVTEFTLSHSNLQAKQQYYSGLINGGNTASLLQTIAGLSSSNRTQVRQLLASYSPYLTEEVIKAVLDYPSSVYPHSWGYDLVVANIDVAYKTGFMEYLIKKSDPMPSSYVSKIRSLVAKKTRTNKFTLETLIADASSRRENAVNLFLTDIANDSIKDLDSLRYWMNQRNDPYSMVGIIDSYLEAGDFNAASAQITALSNSISSYPAEMQNEMSELVNFKTMLVQKLSIPGAITNLNANDLQMLRNFANDNNCGIASYQAQELLCFFYGECVNRLSNSNTNVPQFKNVLDVDEAGNTEFKIKLYPNPAFDQVTLELPINEKEVQLSISTLTGKVVHRQNVSGSTFTFETKELPNGSYFVSVQLSSGEIIIEKLIVNH